MGLGRIQGTGSGKLTERGGGFLKSGGGGQILPPPLCFSSDERRIISLGIYLAAECVPACGTRKLYHMQVTFHYEQSISNAPKRFENYHLIH